MLRQYSAIQVSIETTIQPSSSRTTPNYFKAGEAPQHVRMLDRGKSKGVKW